MAMTGAATAASGDLDPTFGGDGSATAPLDTGATPSKVVIQSDGKVLVLSGGYAQAFDVVTRFNADGTPDATFGANGQAHLDHTNGVFVDLIVMTDGDIVAVGYAGSPSTGVVARLTPLGQPDTAFDGDGVLQLDPGTNNFMQLGSAYEQSGGDLVVVGMKGGLQFSGNLGVFATRLDATGATDATYGTNGTAFSDDITPSGVCGAGVAGLAVQPDGSTLVNLVQGCGTGTILFVYRLGAGGDLVIPTDELIDFTGGSVAGTATLPGGGMLIAANTIMGMTAPSGCSSRCPPAGPWARWCGKTPRSSSPVWRRCPMGASPPGSPTSTPAMPAVCRCGTRPASSTTPSAVTAPWRGHP